MPWLPAIGIGILTGIIGLLTSGLVTDCYLVWYHRPNDVGSSFLVVGMALLGGLLASILGVIVARVMGPGGWKVFGSSSGLVLAVNGLIATALYLGADIPPTIGGQSLRLEMEIRLPLGHAKPLGKGEFILASAVDGVQKNSQSGELRVDAVRLEDDRWIVPAEAKLFSSRGMRITAATIGDEDIGGFVVPLPKHPGEAYERWSEWYPQSRPGDPPWPNTKSSFRIRVARIPPPSPPPTAQEWAAQRKAMEQAKFDLIPADAPISDLIPYTEPHIAEKRRIGALKRIISRPALVRELSSLMLTDGPYDEAAREAAAALHLIGRLDPPSADLIPGVLAAGRDIVARIRKFNASTPEQDPNYEAAADVDIRFNGWMDAVRNLRAKAGGNFLPELREILELSRVRPDSQAMQGDIRRVASYYMKLWGGVEPLPSDPPPR
ncbi:MAG: hypothetical protein H7A55_14665 [Verrucomicrobiaceae bacterium]|nr:hypothetical protein [Verrucomicrobiaceae bacterium]